MTIWSAEIKEIERLYDSIKGQSPALEMELERLIIATDENMVLVYSRRCLEVIITDLCECELRRPRKTEPLQGIKTDPLFNSMRDEPEFQQIVRDVEAKYQAEHERVRKWLEEQGML